METGDNHNVSNHLIVNVCHHSTRKLKSLMFYRPILKILKHQKNTDLHSTLSSM